MAETVQLNETSSGNPARAAGRSASNKPKKALMIVAVVMIQMIGAYFLVGFLLRHDSQGSQETTPSVQPTVQRNPDPSFEHGYVVKDLIVNPAGTNGLRFLLTTIGLEVTSEETVKELEKRDVQIHDSIIGILTSKTLPELDETSTRDSLKVSIKDRINKDLVTGSIVNVYFSKFIIQ